MTLVEELAGRVVQTYDEIVWDGSDAAYMRTHSAFMHAMNELRNLHNMLNQKEQQMTDKTTFSVQINHPIVKQLIDVGLTPKIVLQPSYGPAIVEFIVTQEEKLEYVRRCVSSGAHHGKLELDQVSTRVKTI